jgi:hypothetical protein
VSRAGEAAAGLSTRARARAARGQQCPREPRAQSRRESAAAAARQAAREASVPVAAAVATWPRLVTPPSARTAVAEVAAAAGPWAGRLAGSGRRRRTGGLRRAAAGPGLSAPAQLLRGRLRSGGEGRGKELEKKIVKRRVERMFAK